MLISEAKAFILVELPKNPHKKQSIMITEMKKEK